MGLFLRKKSSKASLKAKDERKGMVTPPPQLPPLPDHIRRAEAAAAAAAAANPPVVNNRTRRRSRSLWADSDDAKAAVTFASAASSAGDLASQPWRSHDAWIAFQNPSAPKAVLDELVFPCSPSAAPGWRGRGGGGLFSTEGMVDHETIRRAGTPTAPLSPASQRRFASPIPSSMSPPARRLDFGSPLAGQERAVTPPESLLMTPRARQGSDGLTPSPADGVLLTPHSLESSNNSTGTMRSPSPSPSPAPYHAPAHPSLSATAPVAVADATGAPPSRSPRRALPPPPESSNGHGQPDEEVIDFSRSTDDSESLESPVDPLPATIPPHAIPKRRSSSSSFAQHQHRTSGSSQYYMPRSSPSPVPSVYSPAMSSNAFSPAMSSGAFASPAMSPAPGEYMAPMRLPSRPRRPSGSTPSMLPYAQPIPQPKGRHAPSPAPMGRSYEQPPRSYDAHRSYERPPSRNTSSGSRGQSSRPPSRNASSSSHGHSAVSGYHSDAASVPVPHTPEGIAQAVSLWRQKSQRREVEAAIAAGMVHPNPPVWPQKHFENPDVFAAAGAWEAPGSYNPYDAAEFEHSFTAPLRVPKPPHSAHGHGAPVHGLAGAGAQITRRPSAGHAVRSAPIQRSPRVQQQVAQPGWI